jgi:hypothetical protein
MQDRSLAEGPVQPHCQGMTNTTELTFAPGDPAAPLTDRLRLATTAMTVVGSRLGGA